jgi:NADH-quinone oxidoreductase subunit L
LIHAATMVNAGVYLLARFYPAFEAVTYWKTAVVAVGSITALLAAVMAIFAYDLKRVLAYSTISQLGYMVYAIGTGDIFASQFHLLSHSVFKALLFLGAGAVIHTVGTRDMRQMGRQNVQMPFVRTVFIFGALALAGIPILNGFWSKELVLESGLAEGPGWAYVLMVIGAGLTAFYTYRMVWMVFFADSTQPGHSHVHDAPAAMRTALAPLALGAWTTWLLAGPFSALLADTLPFHEINVETTWEYAIQVITAPATWLVLVVIALGLAAWHFRESLEWLARPISGLGRLARDGFGFEDINRWIVNTTISGATSLRLLQTGQLNWNMVGIIVGLIAVLVWFAWAL